jgi:predicted histidine transporter YuiF (NhaC family)
MFCFLACFFFKLILFQVCRFFFLKKKKKKKKKKQKQKQKQKQTNTHTHTHTPKTDKECTALSDKCYCCVKKVMCASVTQREIIGVIILKVQRCLTLTNQSTSKKKTQRKKKTERKKKK